MAQKIHHPRGLGDAVFHRDVGALQLLRDARVSHPVHDSARRSWRPRIPDRARGGHLRPLHWRAYTCMRSPGGWIADRMLGQYRAVLLGGIIIAAGHFRMAFPSLPFFYARPRAHRHRYRFAEAERQRAGRIPVRREETRAAMQDFRSSTWASTSAPFSARSSAVIWRRKWIGTSGSPAPASE